MEIKMSAVSAVSDRVDISNLRQKIFKDVEPWKATANKVR